MKKWIIILLSLIAIGAIVAVIFYKFYVNKAHKDIENADADYKLKTEVLYKEYTSTKAHADSLYNGKVVQISGKVDKIETSDTLVIAVFTFAKDDFGDAGIRCTMLKKHNEDAKKIAVGTVISVKGLCSGYNDTDVILEKCSIVKE